MSNLKLIFLVLSISFYLIHENSFCQSSTKIDSLESKLEIQSDNLDKTTTLLALVQEYIQNDPLKALIYCNNLHILSTKLNYLPGEIDALSHKTKIYNALGNYDSALIVANRVINISDSINDKKRLAESYSNLGVTIFRKGDTQQALEYFVKSNELYELLKDSLGIANSLNGIGVMYMSRADYEKAITYFLQLIKISDIKGYENILGKAYINIGTAYYEMKEDDKALYYYLESIKINERLNNLIHLGNAYNNLGNILDRNGKYDSAWIFFNKAIELSTKTNFKRGLPNAYIGLGNILVEKEKYKEAFDYYQLAKDAYQSIGDIEGFVISYKNQGLMYEKWGNYDKSIQIYDSCLLVAQGYELTDRIIELYNNLYTSYWLKKDFQNAFIYLLNHTELKDSIMGLKKTEIIHDLQLKYETEKSQAQILTLEKENLEKDLSLRKRTNQKNIYLFSGSGIISIVLFLLIFYRHKANKDRIISEQKIQQLEEEKKLLAARSIVNGQEEERKRIAKELHDGLGVLLSTAKMQFTTIRDKSPENKPLIDKATKLLEQAAGDVRKISHNMMPGLLTKFGLYEAAEDLIEQVDETEGLNAVCEITGDTKRLQENTEIMLYRIIQEMVNNTIKHAEAKTISLKMEILPGLLKIFYSDDGKGFDTASKLESKSIGLSSIQSRVNFLSGQVSVESKPQEGVMYVIKIPI